MMNEDLENEIEAINSIYGDGSLVLDNDFVYILRLPERSTTLRIGFPEQYPAAPPSVLGSYSSGHDTRKGEAAHLVDAFRNAVDRLYQPGAVCMFDVIEEVNSNLANQLVGGAELNESYIDAHELTPSNPYHSDPESTASSIDVHKTQISIPWALSEVLVESKSVFVARSAPVSSTEEAKQYLQQLVDNDKKVRSATHNITAWRIRGKGNITYQDCDDDGETAAGGRVLHLMQLMDVWDVMVIVTRWYGGHHLGPKRFSIINTVAREALVKGGFVADDRKAATPFKR